MMFFSPYFSQYIFYHLFSSQLRREQEEEVSTPLTSQTPGSGSGTNGVNGGDNGHLAASGDSQQMINFRPNARYTSSLSYLVFQVETHIWNVGKFGKCQNGKLSMRVFVNIFQCTSSSFFSQVIDWKCLNMNAIFISFPENEECSSCLLTNQTGN